jgi:hypothetical protein
MKMFKLYSFLIAAVISLSAHAADIAISALPAGTALGGTEVAPFVQGGVTKQVTATQIKTFANTAIPLSSLATQSANTLLGNATSGAAVPSALAIGSCSTSASALLWTTSSGLSCNTAIKAAEFPIGGTVTGGTVGLIPYVATGPVLAQSALFNVDPTIPRFTLGTAAINNTWQFLVDGPNSGQSALTNNSYGAEGVYLVRRFGGTKAAPTALLNNAFMANFASRGYDGVAVDGQGNPSAYNPSAVDITYYTAGDWSGTSHPGMIRFATTPVNGLAATDRLWLTKDGQLLVGAISAGGNLFVNTGINTTCALCVSGEAAISDTDLPMTKWYRGGVLKGYDAIGNGASISSVAAAGDRIIRAEQQLILRTGGDTGGLLIDASGNATFSNTLTTTGALTVNGGGSVNATDLPYLTWKRATVIKSYFGIGNGSSLISSAAAGDAVWRGEQDIWIYAGSGSQGIHIAAAGAITTTGSITTSAPNGGTAGAWKHGINVTATCTHDTTKYIQLDVGGTLYKMATCS